MTKTRKYAATGAQPVPISPIIPIIFFFIIAAFRYFNGYAPANALQIGKKSFVLHKNARKGAGDHASPPLIFSYSLLPSLAQGFSTRYVTSTASASAAAKHKRV